MIERQFDHHIRKSLKNHAENVPADAWTHFESVLDASGQDQVDDPKSFDEGIREQMNRFVLTEQADWNEFEGLFEESVNGTAANEEQFDAMYQENLRDHRVEYDPNTWPILEDKIDEYNRYVRRVIGMKVVEMGLFILLLLTLHNYYPLYKDQLNRSVDKIAQLVTGRQVYPMSERSGALVAPLIHIVRQHSEDHSQVVPVVESTENRSDITWQFMAFDDAKWKARADRGHKQTKAIPLLGKLDLEVRSLNYATDLSENYLHSNDPRDPAVVEILSYDYDQQKTPLFQEFKKPKQTRVSLGYFAGFTTNLVYIPENVYINRQQEEFVFEDKAYIVPGFSTGVLFSFEVDRFGFESGVKYSSVKYSPKKLLRLGSTLNGIVDVSFDNIEFRIVQIPMHLHYSFVQADKWKWFASLGISMNVIAYSAYDVSLRSGGRSVSLANLTNPAPEIKHVENQFLNGGNLNESSYLTGDFSFGVERKINYRWSAVVQPGIQYQFLTDGIGPNYDLINTITLNLGMRMLLGS